MKFPVSLVPLLLLSLLVACQDGTGGTAPPPDPDPNPPAMIPPDAVADSSTVAANSSDNQIAVLSNDLAGDSAFMLTTVSRASNGGTVTINGDFAVYTPAANFVGQDSFSYTITDAEGDTDSALVSISVTGSISANDDFARAAVSTPVRIAVLVNDSASNGVVQLTSFDDSSANGSIVRDDNGSPGDLSDDALVYTPNGGFSGDDSFGYNVADGAGNSDGATVTVSVAEPLLAADDAASVERNSSDNSINVLANDSPGLKVVSVDSSASRPGATVSVAEDGASVIYSPPADFSGTDQFDYTAQGNSEGVLQSDTATVTITVNAAPPAGTAACRTNITQRLAAGQGYCYDAQILNANGITTDLTVFVPHPDQLRANAAATLGAPLADGEPGFAPLLIHSHGYGGSKFGDFSNPSTFLDSHIAKLAWESGYFVITYTQRGFAGSSGQIGVMSPRREGYDFVELTDWAVAHLRENFNFDPREAANIAFDEDNSSHTSTAAAPDAAWGRSLLLTDAGERLSSTDPATDAGNPALATIGYSYGGGFQFNAQSVDTRVDAIMPMGTWFDLRFSLHPNDTPKIAWIALLTSFTFSGSNQQEPPPDVIISANSQANGANADPADQPHNKPRQVSVANFQVLSPNGPVGYCDGNQNLASDPGLTADDGETLNVPANANTRAARAHLFMIQGYGDTLFNYNEGYDNARCFEALAPAGTDVRFLAQTSGHPLPAVGPPQYAGSDTSMYLDEIVHCGLEGGVPRLYVMRDTGLEWFNFHLRGLLPPDRNTDTLQDADDIFPQACITQTNTNRNLVMKTGAENPAFSGNNTGQTAFAWSREGAAFDSIAQMPRGCAGAGSNCTAFDIATVVADPAGFSFMTGPDPNQQHPYPADPDQPSMGSQQPLAGFLSLHQATGDQVLAGIPLVDLQITRANPSQDEIVYVGVAVQRCQLSSVDNDGSGTDCDDSIEPETLHFQVLPMRVFPTAAVDVMNLGPSLTAAYPADDPRNDLANPPNYPIRWGDNPGFAGSTDTALGRLLGVSARLHAGDQVGLIFFGEHPVYKSVSSAAAGQINITGSVQLPLLDPDTAPSDVPDYVQDAGAGG